MFIKYLFKYLIIVCKYYRLQIRLDQVIWPWIDIINKTFNNKNKKAALIYLLCIQFSTTNFIRKEKNK